MNTTFNTLSRRLLVLLLCAMAALCMHGAAMKQMRFHCERDTLRIDSLLSLGAASGITDAGRLVAFYARQLQGTPYVGHTLEGEREMLTIDIDELDCTTFVETLYALARTILDGRRSWRDYAARLENVRYRGGTLGDYSSRLHYISEWIIDNNSRGNLTEVTPNIPHSEYTIKTIDYMSSHADSYQSLKGDTAMVKRIRAAEEKLRRHRMPLLKKSWLGRDDVVRTLRNGDFVGLVTTIDGLDISHMGVIIIGDDGQPYLLDASLSGGKVMLENKPLKAYLSSPKSTITGIRVFRISPNR